MSDSVRPHRRQPTRLPCPWDSPGKNTGVGCHFLLQCVKVKSEREVAQSCPTLRNPMDCSPPGSSAHGISQARGLEWGATAFSDPSPICTLALTPLPLSILHNTPTCFRLDECGGHCVYLFPLWDVFLLLFICSVCVCVCVCTLPRYRPLYHYTVQPPQMKILITKLFKK